MTRENNNNASSSSGQGGENETGDLGGDRGGEERLDSEHSTECHFSGASLESPKTSNEPSPTSKRPKGYKKRNVLSSSFSAVALTDLCEDVDADLLQTARRVPISRLSISATLRDELALPSIEETLEDSVSKALRSSSSSISSDSNSRSLAGTVSISQTLYGDSFGEQNSQNFLLADRTCNAQIEEREQKQSALLQQAIAIAVIQANLAHSEETSSTAGSTLVKTQEQGKQEMIKLNDCFLVEEIDACVIDSMEIQAQYDSTTVGTNDQKLNKNQDIDETAKSARQKGKAKNVDSDLNTDLHTLKGCPHTVKGDPQAEMCPNVAGLIPRGREVLVHMGQSIVYNDFEEEESDDGIDYSEGREGPARKDNSSGSGSDSDSSCSSDVNRLAAHKLSTQSTTPLLTPPEVLLSAASRTHPAVDKLHCVRFTEEYVADLESLLLAAEHESTLSTQREQELRDKVTELSVALESALSGCNAHGTQNREYGAENRDFESALIHTDPSSPLRCRSAPNLGRDLDSGLRCASHNSEVTNGASLETGYEYGTVEKYGEYRL